MTRVTIVRHPPPNGNWPDGEPQQVREAADRLLGICTRSEPIAADLGQIIRPGPEYAPEPGNVAEPEPEL
jgi:hypothetical protein